jgi:hypothetical protein
MKVRTTITQEAINDIKNHQGIDVAAQLESILVWELGEGIRREKIQKTRNEKIDSILNDQ